jgi:phosphotransferase system HPr (HPr) family protein
MSQDCSETRRQQVVISNALGLHMRPANKFANLADRFEAEIRVLCEGRIIDGKSILDLTTLAAEQGTILELEACGPDAAQAIEALVALVAGDFGEDDEGNERLAASPSARPGPNGEPTP